MTVNGSAWHRGLTLLWVAVGCWLAATSFVIVDETELVVVERLGRLHAVYDQADDRGLQAKAPWPIDTVRRFDRRLQLLAPAGREVFTRDRKNLIVETYVAWRITDSDIPLGDSATDRALPARAPEREPASRPVVRFLQSYGAIPIAEAQLSSQLQALLAGELAKHELQELIQVSSADAKAAAIAPSDSIDAPADPSAVARPLEVFASQLKAQLQSALNRQHTPAAGPADSTDTVGQPFSDTGLTIVDLRIRRLNFPASNQAAVFERMRSERRRIAEGYRQSGQAEAQRIRSRADRDAAELLASADSEAARVEAAAEADALARVIASEQADPEFARLFQELEAYREIFSRETTLVLSTGHWLMSLLHHDGPPTPLRTPPEDGLATPGSTPTRSPRAAQRSDSVAPESTPGETP